MSELPKTVVDEDGNVHHIFRDPLGRGGQGVVLRTRSPHIAVKLIAAAQSESSALPTGPAPAPPKDPGVSAQTRLWDGLTKVSVIERSADDAKRVALRRRLEDVRLLPLTDLHLAQPLAMLREHVGYTMRLLSGMVPIRSLIAQPGTSDLSAFYLESGGLRRRLELLANTAALVSRLHAIPLVYADLSPNNVFVSESHEASEVWLIDLDNLDYLSASAPGIYTPGFGAPEVVAGRAGVTTLSDAFSFAVLAFYVLAQVHPFLGDYVEEGGWDSDDDREQLAFEGKIPWIDDADDASNRTARGMQRDLTIPKPLLDLFQRAFGPGRARRDRRPGLAEWTEMLRRLADRVVSCAACGSTFYVAPICPFCDSGYKPTFVHMQVNRWDPDLDDSGSSAIASEAVWRKMLDMTRDCLVPRHAVEPVRADGDDPPVLRFRAVPRGISVEPLSDYEVHVVFGGRLQRIERETRLPLPTPGNEALLHFGPMSRPHRMAVLRYHSGGA